jgi:phosphatidylinositol alpha-1,6-mannosyltransferase
VSERTVLFVSKPIAPPFHDGTKCLVRDIALNLTRVRPSVMSSAGAGPLGSVQLERVYPGSGSFAPGLSDNLRAGAWLLARSRADLWHFVFAPNARTSRFGRVLKTLRRQRVVQTVASPPRSFAEPQELLFGDVVVTQSRWTRTQFLEQYARAGVVPPRMEVVYPPVAALRERTPAELEELKGKLEIASDRVVFVYPGDLETSQGAATVARAVPEIVSRVPNALVVFAYRPKSALAHERARELQSGLDARHVRFTSTLPDVLALIQGARALLFPVDDLWGKVDLPIVLLEAMALGVPVIVLDRGPLAELGGVKRIAEQSPAALARAVVELHESAGERAAVCAAQKRFVESECQAARTARAYEDLYLDLLS